MQVDLEHICKTYDGRVVLNDLGLAIPQGELFVLMGKSGVGKTTLLRLIAGLEHPDSGKISLGELRVFGNQRCVEPHQRGVGFIFQELALWPHLSVGKNCEIVIKGKIKDKKVRREKVKEMLQRLHVEQLADQYPDTLSGGEKQRVALARALITQPQLLLLDEPLTYLDVHLKRQVMGLIKQLHAEMQITTLYVTHLPEEALLLGGRAGILKEGKIEKTGLVNEVVQEFIHAHGG